MTKKNTFLLVLAFLLVGFFLYLNRDWFITEKVEVTHRAGPPLRFSRFGPPNDTRKAVTPLFFEFNRKLKLTSVKVIPVSDIETNKYPHPIWDLAPIYRPVATKGFEYGAEIPGMKATVSGAIPGTLEPGVKYRLLLQAGSLKVEYDFVPEPPKR
jgi:hypothetical protein